jgi:hypothetical protein
MRRPRTSVSSPEKLKTMKPLTVESKLSSNKSVVLLAFCLALACGQIGSAQTVPVRNYNVQFTSTPPVADGVVGANEWSGAAAAAGTWGVLRETSTDVDTENNRFRMLWDATNLYILYETNFNIYADADTSNPLPDISFGADNLNIYVDPNTDDEVNFVTENEQNVDGYQLAFNQYHDPANGTLTSTNANRQGVGFFTEAHHNTPFGDQAGWNNGQPDVKGPALQDIVVAQRNGTTGGVAEIVWPWANFNAKSTVAGTPDVNDYDRNGFVDGNDFNVWQRNLGASTVADSTTGDGNLDFLIDGSDLDLWESAYGTDTSVVTGLDHLNAPVNGEEWFFNMSRINGQGDNGNFLPIWNWHEGQSFAPRPHGTLTFAGAPGIGAVPEPASIALVCFGVVAVAGQVRRRSR